MSLDEAITVSKRGKRELRTLVSRGRFALIEYRDPVTRERTEDKYKLLLLHEDGRVQEFFVIPTKTSGRSMLVEPKEKKGKELKVWNPTTGEIEDIFPSK
ncbi:MAG: hypothetical protein BA066_01575 [Candidatus Korarchaeota archaeon NZ13-K]|nr:MAG: hypothetical protein BA066_01575 [Candidatus Korarchaeota archaeon NZ13-K]